METDSGTLRFESGPLVYVSMETGTQDGMCLYACTTLFDKVVNAKLQSHANYGHSV